MKYADKMNGDLPDHAFTSYQEKKIGKTLYRVTSVYMGKFELAKALEKLTLYSLRPKTLRSRNHNNDQQKTKEKHPHIANNRYVPE